MGQSNGPEGAVLWVDDDGPGIPPDQLTRVFDRHFTTDRDTGRRKGSGLGLAIVAELAGAMGARVSAESPIGPERTPGTRMVVRLRPAPSTEIGPSPSVPSTVDPHRTSSNLLPLCKG